MIKKFGLLALTFFILASIVFAAEETAYQTPLCGEPINEETKKSLFEKSKATFKELTNFEVRYDDFYVGGASCEGKEEYSLSLTKSFARNVNVLTLTPKTSGTLLIYLQSTISQSSLVYNNVTVVGAVIPTRANDQIFTAIPYNADETVSLEEAKTLLILNSEVKIPTQGSEPAKEAELKLCDGTFSFVDKGSKFNLRPLTCEDEECKVSETGIAQSCPTNCQQENYDKAKRVEGINCKINYDKGYMLNTFRLSATTKKVGDYKCGETTMTTTPGALNGLTCKKGGWECNGKNACFEDKLGEEKLVFNCGKEKVEILPTTIRGDGTFGEKGSYNFQNAKCKNGKFDEIIAQNIRHTDEKGANTDLYGYENVNGYKSTNCGFTPIPIQQGDWTSIKIGLAQQPPTHFERFKAWWKAEEQPIGIPQEGVSTTGCLFVDLENKEKTKEDVESCATQNNYVCDPAKNGYVGYNFDGEKLNLIHSGTLMLTPNGLKIDAKPANPAEEPKEADCRLDGILQRSKAELTAQQIVDINSFVAIIKDKKEVYVYGFASTDSSEKFNKKLSENRAGTIKNAITKKDLTVNTEGKGEVEFFGRGANNYDVNRRFVISTKPISSEEFVVDADAALNNVCCTPQCFSKIAQTVAKPILEEEPNQIVIPGKSDCNKNYVVSEVWGKCPSGYKPRINIKPKQKMPKIELEITVEEPRDEDFLPKEQPSATPEKELEPEVAPLEEPYEYLYPYGDFRFEPSPKPSQKEQQKKGPSINEPANKQRQELEGVTGEAVLSEIQISGAAVKYLQKARKPECSLPGIYYCYCYKKGLNLGAFIKKVKEASKEAGCEIKNTKSLSNQAGCKITLPEECGAQTTSLTVQTDKDGSLVIQKPEDKDDQKSSVTIHKPNEPLALPQRVYGNKKLENGLLAAATYSTKLFTNREGTESGYTVSIQAKIGSLTVTGKGEKLCNGQALSLDSPNAKEVTYKENEKEVYNCWKTARDQAEDALIWNTDWKVYREKKVQTSQLQSLNELKREPTSSFVKQ
ncbi:OmpA family protein [Candidatus Woesearchaeota archaeon]|nr:OmpA family protein [Candidatus Woesearchaeota archaeon]